LKLVGGRGAAFPRRKVWTEECDRELSCIRCLWLFIFCCQRCFSFEQLLIVQTSSLAAVAVPWQVELGRGIYYLLSVLLCARLFELSYSRSSSFGHGAARVSAPLVSCNRRHVLFHTCVNAMCARLFELSYSRSSSLDTVLHVYQRRWFLAVADISFFTGVSTLLCARLFELSYARSSSFGHGAARVSAPLVSCSQVVIDAIVRKTLRA